LPRAIRRKGLEMGIWETFSPAVGFNVVAGARTVYFLSKISDAGLNKKLYPFGIRAKNIPHMPMEQWQAFKTICHHYPGGDDWKMDILFLSKHWVQKILNEPHLQNFKLYLVEKALAHTMPNRTVTSLDLVWEKFMRRPGQQKRTRNLYLIEIFKRIIMAAAGDLPIMKIVNAKNDLLPYQTIVDVYLQHYGMKHYTPTMMYADYFQLKQGGSGYYPLSIPLDALASAKNKNYSSARSDLVHLIQLFDEFVDEIRDGVEDQENAYFANLLSNIQLDFYHTEPDADQGIYQADELLVDDISFQQEEAVYNGRKICFNSGFFKGCVRISAKNYVTVSF
jgi:hypothetical protein